MSDYSDVYELADYYDKLSRELPYPKSPTKPNRADYPNHEIYGKALDAFDVDMGQWRELRKEYRKASYRITFQFKDALLEFLEVSNHPKAEKLWNLAWEAGHSSGYREIAMYAEEFLELMI